MSTNSTHLYVPVEGHVVILSLGAAAGQLGWMEAQAGSPIEKKTKVFELKPESHKNTTYYINILQQKQQKC